MVKVFFISLMFLILMPLPSGAMTATELRELSGIGRAKRGERDGRIKTQELNNLIPEGAKNIPSAPEKAAIEEKHKDTKDTKETKDDDSPNKSSNNKSSKKIEAKKYNAEADDSEIGNEGQAFLPNNKAEAAPLGKNLSPRMFKQETDGIYVPPPRTGGFGPLTDAPTPDNMRVFGIRIGTWIRGELRRQASSSEPGLIEIYTTETVRGDKKDLPPGSTLFAEKTYNAGTKKQDLLVEKGITPEGREFVIKGLVFDLQKTAGLNGIISADSEMIVERSTSKGVLAAGAAAAENIAGGSIVGSAASGAAESLLKDSAEVVNESKTLKQTIRSVPQTLLIRVEETF